MEIYWKFQARTATSVGFAIFLVGVIVQGAGSFVFSEGTSTGKKFKKIHGKFINFNNRSSNNSQVITFYSISKRYD